MHPHRKSRLAAWLARLLPSRRQALTDIERARAVVAAVDAGGMPLNPAVINDIARGLGLEVSRKAPVEATIERIRAALLRHDGSVGTEAARRR